RVIGFGLALFCAMSVVGCGTAEVKIPEKADAIPEAEDISKLKDKDTTASKSVK
ncbi:MAG: hypothetical protein JNL67_04560, partial [Planctomycetaceae bacterium]|nr:hypothetical protein [Planctomycetaceae bacterium]